MSWDIHIQDFPRNVATVAEIPGDFQPASLGPRSDLIASIERAFEKADFTDPSWGFIEEENWSIEVNIGDDEVCDSIMLHVRGDDGAVGAVAKFLKVLDLRAIDCQTGEFFSSGPQSTESFAVWQKFRDQVVDGDGNDE